MKKIISIISFLFLVLMSLFLSSAALAGSEIYVGFIDTGTWDSKGSIFLEVNYKSAEAKEKCEILTEKLFQANKKAVFPVKYDSIKNYINSGASDAFDVYNSKGYLGRYPTASYMLITNECGGAVYPYIKLDAKLATKTNEGQNYVIAHKKSSDKYTVLKNIDLKNTNDNIKKIINEKNKLAKDKFKKINDETSREINKFSEKKDYSIYQISRDQYFIHCVWYFKHKQEEIDTRYYITNSFIVRKDKVLEVEDFKSSYGDEAEIVYYKLAVKSEDLIFFVTERLYYEGNSAEILELKNSKLIRIHDGNYFGC